MVVDTLLSWLVPIMLVVLATLLLYVYSTWPMSTWSEVGVAGPKPAPFFGNMNTLKEKGMHTAQRDWGQEYGKVYGIYILRQPALMTTDLDILKEVFVKDFNNFAQRSRSFGTIDGPLSSSLFFVNGDTWRRQRHTMSPTFSASRLKLMGRFITRCCDNLVAAVRTLTNEEKPMDVKQLFGAFTLDVITGTSFGLDTNSLAEQEQSVLLQSAVRMLSRTGSTAFNPVGFLLSLFPALTPIVYALGFHQTPQMDKEVDFIAHTIQGLVQERKSDVSKGHSDLLQLMLNAESTEAEVKANPQDKRLTLDEVVAQGILFFIAGYETTSTALQYLTYLLAVNPEKQDKLYKDIVSTLSNEQPSYENVTSIRYLDNCIYEALRMFPPVSLVGRKALKTCTIKDVTIPAGSDVFVCVYQLMRNEDLFPEAEKFIPERYDDNTHPTPAFVKEMMFGAGPRQCIGLRLAMYEIKMVMIHLLTRFKFVRIPQTPETITFKQTMSLTIPDKPLLVGTECRLQSS